MWAYWIIPRWLGLVEDEFVLSDANTIAIVQKIRNSLLDVFVEVSLTGTQQGDFAGIPPTGRSVKTRIGCLFEFEGDQLVRERVYLDLADILRQPGALPS